MANNESQGQKLKECEELAPWCPFSIVAKLGVLV